MRLCAAESGPSEDRLYCKRIVGHPGFHYDDGITWESGEEMKVTHTQMMRVPYGSLDDLPSRLDTCDDCGQPLFTGAWPFCASPANPDGHARGAYGFKMGWSMKTQGWTRRER